jgi:molybdate transport system substrate-binding protein
MDSDHATPCVLHGISSMAVRGVLADLVDAYAERPAGARSRVTSVGGIDAARRVSGGEAFDFVVLADDAIDRLAAEGRVVAHSRVGVARSAMAVAVAEGAPRPDIGSEAALRDALRNARAVAYSTGPSGSHLLRLFERWGIADVMTGRTVLAPPGTPVGTLVARGDADVGVQQLSELMHVDGIAVVGELPPDAQSVTLFTGAICTASTRAPTAASLLAYLASPQADGVKRRHGMEPA